MKTKPKGRKPINTAAFNKISSIDIGKSIIMQRKNWKLVVPPGAHILRKYFRREYEVRSLIGDSGWIIKRK